MFNEFIKTKIKRYCLKHLRPHINKFDNYMFWRFLIEYTQNQDKVDYIIRKLAWVTKDIYPKSIYIIFDDLIYIDEYIIIVTTRTDMWIGKQGCHYKQLLSDMRKALDNNNIKIKFIDNNYLNNKKFIRAISRLN